MPAAPHPLVLRAREALQRGDIRAVEAAAEERLKTAGRDINALELRFIVQQKRGQYGQAARTLDTVIGIDQQADWAYNELIQLYMTHGKRDEAEKVARTALRTNPRNATAHHLFGTILTEMGQLPPAQWHLKAALELGGAQAPALSNLPRAPNPADAHLARGREHETAGNYSAAWEEFTTAKANVLKESQGMEYRANAVESLFEHCKQFFTRETASLLARAKQRPQTPQPVFVMGFPRSGTALVEKILASHSAIAAGGNLPFVGDMGKLASHAYPGTERFPESLAHSWMADYCFTANLFRDYYLGRAEGYGLLSNGRQYFTDTMPFNEIYLPLIKMAFPAAKIVRVVRHPLDVCVSMISNNVTDPVHCGNRVEDTAHHLAAAFDLVEHYHKVLGLEDFVLRYETLIGEHATAIPKLLEYLGLPVEEPCLAHKLHVRSINRYRHYEQHLRPYVARLQPLMSAHGYKA
jgi:tetratricopeptide (TPR) repeat protein